MAKTALAHDTNVPRFARYKPRVEDVEHEIAGHAMRDMWFWSPPCGLGCGASILSYAGKVRVGIRADSVIMPDPEAVARWFVEELEAVDQRAPGEASVPTGI